MSEQEIEKGDGQERRRINVACTRCRRRKIKCSGDQDGNGCQNCRQSGCDPSGCIFQRMNSTDLPLHSFPNPVSNGYSTTQTSCPYRRCYPDHTRMHLDGSRYVNDPAYPHLPNSSTVATSNGLPMEYMASAFDQIASHGPFTDPTNNNTYGIPNGYIPPQQQMPNGSVAVAGAPYGINTLHAPLQANGGSNGSRNLPAPTPIHPAIPIPNNIMPSLGSRYSVGWGPEARTTNLESHDSVPQLSYATNTRSMSAIHPRGSDVTPPTQAQLFASHHIQTHNHPLLAQHPYRTTSNSDNTSDYALPSMRPPSGLPTLLPSASSQSSSSTSTAARNWGSTGRATASPETAYGIRRQASSLDHYSFSGNSQSRRSSHNSYGVRRRSGEQNQNDSTGNSDYHVSAHAAIPDGMHGTPVAQSSHSGSAHTRRSTDTDSSRSTHSSPVNVRMQTTSRTGRSRGSL